MMFSVVVAVVFVFLFFFQNFGFPDCYSGKSAKNGPKWQKIVSVALDISGTIYLMIAGYGTKCVKW